MKKYIKPTVVEIKIINTSILAGSGELLINNDEESAVEGSAALSKRVIIWDNFDEE